MPGFRAVLERSPAHRSTVSPVILRRLYLYLVSAAALALLAGGLAALGATILLFVFNDPSADTNRGQLAVFTAMTVVALPVWGIHFWFARRFAMRDPFERASATLRRWYMYIALLVGLLTMLAGAAFLLQIGWTRLVLASADKYLYLSLPAGSTLAGALLWGFHARTIAVSHQADDRHSTLRALEGFIAVAISIATALFGATQILYYALARALGVSDPGGAGTNLLAALATPGSLLLVYGVAWFLVRRRLARDAGTQEADRQAGVRPLLTQPAAPIFLGALG